MYETLPLSQFFSENRNNSKSWHESPIRGSSMNISIAKSVYLAKKLFTSELEAIGHAGLGSIELNALELKVSLSFEKSRPHLIDPGA